MKKKLIFFIAVSLICMMSLSVDATTYVNLDYDGDAAFPRLTWQYDVGTLNTFTGTSFRTGGFSGAEMSTVQSSISTFLYEDYSAYDIEFVTDTTGLTDWLTVGIDDAAYVYTFGPSYPVLDPTVACPEASGCSRLFGKTENSTGDLANDGTPIYQEGYSRLFAGSFALGAGSASPSSPSLFGATLVDISQALGNLFSHEIAHFFNVLHPNEGSQSATWSAHHGWDLMYVEVESVESTTNKYFSSGDNAILLSALGSRCTGAACNPDPDPDPCTDCPTQVPEPSTLILLGSGLIGLVSFRKRMK